MLLMDAWRQDGVGRMHCKNGVLVGFIGGVLGFGDGLLFLVSGVLGCQHSGVVAFPFLTNHY